MLSAEPVEVKPVRNVSVESFICKVPMSKKDEHVVEENLCAEQMAVANCQVQPEEEQTGLDVLEEKKQAMNAMNVVEISSSFQESHAIEVNLNAIEVNLNAGLVQRWRRRKWQEYEPAKKVALVCMARTSTALRKSFAALSKGSFRAASPSSAAQPPSSIRPASSRILRLRGAIVSLQALHAARSQALFVSRLSFGSQELELLIQDGEDGT
ncbi:hypothetical protein L7F22_068578 [Adiantum nelumboides]|nr:hypothetical protein [Adiantum nelumboides]